MYPNVPSSAPNYTRFIDKNQLREFIQAETQLLWTDAPCTTLTDILRWILHLLSRSSSNHSRSQSLNYQKWKLSLTSKFQTPNRWLTWMGGLRATNHFSSEVRSLRRQRMVYRCAFWTQPMIATSISGANCQALAVVTLSMLAKTAIRTGIRKCDRAASIGLSVLGPKSNL